MGSAASIAVAAVVCVVSIVVTGVMGYFLYRKTRLANIQREQLEHYENEIEQLTSHNSTKHLVSVKISESMEEVHATLPQRNNTCEAEESTRTSPFGTESEISGRAPPQGHVAPNNKSNNKTTERRVIKNILKRGCTPRSCCSSNTTEVQSHTISPSKNPVRCNQVLDNEQWTPASDYGLQEDLQFGDLNSERRLGGTSRTLDPVPLCMPLPAHRSTEHTSHNVLEVLNPVRRRLLTLHTSCTYHPISMAPKKLYPTHNASSKGCQTEGYILHIPEEGITLKTVDGLNQAQFCRTQLDGCSTDGGPLVESEFAARYSDPNGGAYAARLTSQRLSYSARNAAAQFTFTPIRNDNPNQSKGTCYNSCSKTVDVEDENLLHLSPPCAMQDVTDENRTPLPSVKKGGFSYVDPGRLNGTSQNESNTALVKRQMKEGMSHRAPTGVDTSIKSGRELNFLSEMDGNRLANAMHSNELVGAPNAIYCSVSPARQSTSQNGCWLMGPVELRVFHSELPSEVPQGSNVHTRTLSFPAASVERMSFTNSVPHV